MVTGSFGAADRLGVQLAGPGRVAGVEGHEIPEQAPGQQHVVAKPPGPLDRFLPDRSPASGSPGEEMRAAPCPKGSAEQPLVTQLAATRTACSASCRAVAASMRLARIVAVTSAAPNSAGSAPASGRGSAGMSSLKVSGCRGRHR